MPSTRCSLLRVGFYAYLVFIVIFCYLLFLALGCCCCAFFFTFKLSYCFVFGTVRTQRTHKWMIGMNGSGDGGGGGRGANVRNLVIVFNTWLDVVLKCAARRDLRDPQHVVFSHCACCHTLAHGSSLCLYSSLILHLWSCFCFSFRFFTSAISAFRGLWLFWAFAVCACRVRVFVCVWVCGWEGLALLFSRQI